MVLQGILRNGQRLLPVLTQASLKAPINVQQLRFRRTKHFNPKFKWFRTRKYIKVDLPEPDDHEKDEPLSEEMSRTKLKKLGVQPFRPWDERPFFIGSTGTVFEPYVPPEGDGKRSFITTEGAKQKFRFIEKKSRSMLAMRTIRNYEDDFNEAEFCQHAQDTYIAVHESMARGDKKRIEELCTEKALPLVLHNVDGKTIRWRFLGSIEPPRLVHARYTDVVTKENLFGQITVRFHTQQILSVYDRFGRLMHGSEILAKDVLEYIVFEKHLSNQYGKWRLHDKIIPDWMPKPEPSRATRLLKEEPVGDAVEVVDEKKADVEK